MARLIVEEGGQRRGFKLKGGKLTLGSGEECTLRLTSPDVAEVHAELELSDAGAILRPRPGVLPPVLDGRPVTSEVQLPASCRFEIGSAILQLEADAPAPAPAAAPVAAPAARPPAARRAAPARTARGPARAARRDDDEGESRVQHRRRQVKSGMPTWLILLLCAGGLGAVFLVYRAWLGGGAAEPGFSPTERYRVALGAYQERNLKRADDELDNVDLARATPELKALVEDLRAKIDEGREHARIAGENVIGSKWKSTQLEGFVKKYMSGDSVGRPHARVFVKRCQEFRRRWPQHDDMDWVDRYQRRFEDIAKLSEPPTFEDLAFEVKTLTWAMPRDYEEAFELLDGFLADCSGTDCEKAQALVEEQREARVEYFDDRMQQAKWLWERGEKQNDSRQKGESVEWLVQIVMKIGDQEMADKAAFELVRLPGIEEWFRGYRNDRPEQFERLVRNDTVRELAQRAGLL